MSDTPKLADECKRLLDNGWRIQLFKNELGSYSAVAVQPQAADLIPDWEDLAAFVDGRMLEPITTDDFEPSQALYRLTEKVFGNIA